VLILVLINYVCTTEQQLQDGRSILCNICKARLSRTILYGQYIYGHALNFLVTANHALADAGADWGPTLFITTDVPNISGFTRTHHHPKATMLLALALISLAALVLVLAFAPSSIDRQYPVSVKGRCSLLLILNYWIACFNKLFQTFGAKSDL
jgi:hypothetical protein